MPQMNKLVLLIVSLFIFSLIHCHGGSSEQGNARVEGCVLSTSDNSATIVRLVSEAYIPDSDRPLYETQANDSGVYYFDNVILGSYYLYAVNSKNGSAILRGPFDINGEEMIVATAVLEPTGRIVAAVYDTTIKRMYIQGIGKPIDISGAKVVIDSVPCGEIKLKIVNPECDSGGNCFNFPDGDVFATIQMRPSDTTLVTFQNAAPVFLAGSKEDVELVNGDTYTETLSALDPDTDTVYYELINARNGMVIDSLTGVIMWSPVVDTPGIYRIGVRASDSAGASTVLWWSIQVIS